jgi:HD-like signal output (HDOD) protein
MMYVALIVAVLAGVAAWGMLRVRKPVQESIRPTATPASAPPLATPVIPTRWEIPPELQAFRRVEGFELSVEAQRALVDRLVRIPRPSDSAQKLLSVEFLEQATAEVLAEHILAEPHVAARVLATVNSPFYGMPKPVTSVQQAILLLGLDTVRSIAVQCLMSEALRPSDERLKPVFDRWWHASALAGQLCLKLGQRTGVPDPGSMVTLAVLSFLGHMAALSLLPPEQTLENASLGFLERTRREQQALGLCAGELGCLLMNEWHMPPTIVEDVRAIDRVLTTPPKQLDPQRGLRMAMSYYCARLAEKLASGEWVDLQAAAPEMLEGPEFFHLQTHFMIHPRMTQLAHDFRDPRFVAEVADMVRAVRAA